MLCYFYNLSQDFILYKFFKKRIKKLGKKRKKQSYFSELWLPCVANSLAVQNLVSIETLNLVFKLFPPCSHFFPIHFHLVLNLSTLSSVTRTPTHYRVVYITSFCSLDSDKAFNSFLYFNLFMHNVGTCFKNHAV